MPAISREVRIEMVKVDHPQFIQPLEPFAMVIRCEIGVSDDDATIRKRVVAVARAHADLANRIGCLIFGPGDCVYLHPGQEPFESKNPMNSAMTITRGND